jgi:hypothetical protein
MKLLPLALALLPSAAASHSHGPARGLLGLGGCMENRPVPPSTLSSCSGEKLVSASLDKKAVEKGGEVTLTWSSDASYAPSTSDWLGFFCSDDLDSLEDTEYVRPKRARSEREPERTNCGAGCVGGAAWGRGHELNRGVSLYGGSGQLSERRDQTQASGGIRLRLANQGLLS